MVVMRNVDALFPTYPIKVNELRPVAADEVPRFSEKERRTEGGRWFDEVWQIPRAGQCSFRSLKVIARVYPRILLNMCSNFLREEIFLKQC